MVGKMVSTKADLKVTAMDEPTATKKDEMTVALSGDDLGFPTVGHLDD